MLGVPNAPSVYDPTKNLHLAEQRQSQVLDAMVKFEKLSVEDATQVESIQKTK